MALPVLDGNQSATTLSSVVTGGEHIVAHSVVSLGATAISNINSAVSGSAVTIPGLARLGNSIASNGSADANLDFIKIGGHQDGQNQVAHIVHVSAGGAMKVDASDSSITFGVIRGTVTVGNSITISNFPDTQVVRGSSSDGGGNIALRVNFPGSFNNTRIQNYSSGDLLFITPQNAAKVDGSAVTQPITGTITVGNSVTIGSIPAISGTVTVGASSVTFNSNVAKNPLGSWQPLYVENGSGFVGARVYSSDSDPLRATVTVGNSVTIGSLPAISGTVTANLLAQKQIATAAPTSAVLAGIKFDDDGTIQPISSAYPVPAYLPLESSGIGASQPNNAIQVGFETGGNYVAAGSTFPFPVTGTVTIGSLPAISGTVTANAGSGTFNVSNRGATGVATVTSITATTSVTLMASNSNRKLLTIYNEGAGNLHVLYGSGTATTANYSVKLFSGDYLEIDKYTGQVNAIFATAGTARVTEIT